MKPEILVASGNLNKIAELQRIADPFGFRLRSPAEVALELGLPPIGEVPETEDTYLGNARLKAVAYAQWAQMAVVADDSGLEVKALGGRPGVLSARFGGEGLNSRERNQLVLDELATLDPGTDRSACFRCALVFVAGDGWILEVESELPGKILDNPRGEGGFGYDPIVFIHELGCTLAELDFSITCDRGFRALAAKELFEKLNSKFA